MKRINITCPACGSMAYLRPASVVYGDKAPDPDAKYYVCGRYALNFGKETVQVIDTSEWMGRSYELIAVLYTHKPTGFQFTNYCIRPAGIISSSSRHDLLLYDWAEHQAGADSY